MSLCPSDTTSLICIVPMYIIVHNLYQINPICAKFHMPDTCSLLFIAITPRVKGNFRTVANLLVYILKMFYRTKSSIFSIYYRLSFECPNIKGASVAITSNFCTFTRLLLFIQEIECDGVVSFCMFRLNFVNIGLLIKEIKWRVTHTHARAHTHRERIVI
jgi:hypothetical protein